MPPRTGGKPNIVLIIGDDYGWPYYGFMGSKEVLTPNLDALARGGTLFTRGHSTSSVCLPSLNTMLTGLHPYTFEEQIRRELGRNDFLGMDELAINSRLLRDDALTLPRVLAQAGYSSFEGGKLWNVSYEDVGFTEGMTKPKRSLKKGASPGKGASVRAFAGDEGLDLARVTNQPVYDFIDRHSEKPFFIWYAPMLPHSPMDPPAKYLKLYESREDLSASAKKYYANCTRLDDSVGQLVNHLREAGLLEHTLILYFSDNGWEQPAGEDYTNHRVYKALAGPKGKLSAHEFGFRTPILLYHPGVVPAGVRKEGLVSQLDLFHTVLDYAGATPPPHRPGHSLRATVEGKEDFARDQIIGSMRLVRIDVDRAAKGKHPWANLEDTFYVTTPDWHHISYEGRGLEELYDKRSDPEEAKNVARDYPELIKKFRADIQRWREEMSATAPRVFTPSK